MLFPALGPTYYDEKDRGLLSKMEQFYTSSLTINQSFWAEADIDSRFYVGDQAINNTYYMNSMYPFGNSKNNFFFNRIRPVVQNVTGYQRRNRKSTIAVPVENSDQRTADQFSKILMWNDEQENVGYTISDAFEGALVTGMSLLQVWMDYRSDPLSGNIRVNNCAYNSFMIDPFFKKTDLSDCNGLWKRSYLTKRECISLLPSHTDEILGLPSAINNRDGKFQFMPQSYDYGPTNLMTYDEYYYRDYRTQLMVIDPNTGEGIEWRGSDEDLKRYLQAFPVLTTMKNEIPTVRLAIVVQGKVMKNDLQENGLDCYPFVPVFGYYNPQIPDFPWRVQGLVRGLRDAQYLYNRRKVIELDILESQINSGLKVKENALVNFEDVFLMGQGKPLVLKKDAAMTDVERMTAPDVPQSMIQLSEILGKEIQQLSGVNEELLGSAIDDKAGILSALRQGAGLTTLQKLFDQLDNSQKMLGKIRLQLVQNNFTPGKVKRIIQEDPSEQFYDKTFGRYDAAVEEGFNTTTQKQLQFAQLMQMKGAGMNIPEVNIIQAATLQNKQELIDSMEAASKQQQEMQQMQIQVQMQELQSRSVLSQATAHAQQGLGDERYSRIPENRALAEERVAEAQKDRELGFLHLMKALSELESLDLEKMKKIAELTRIVKDTDEKNILDIAQDSLS